MQLHSQNYIYPEINATLIGEKGFRHNSALRLASLFCFAVKCCL